MQQTEKVALNNKNKTRQHMFILQEHRHNYTFLIDCNSNKSFRKCWARWWQSITNFDITIVGHIH